MLVRLLLLNFDPAAEPASQLRQCLAVFFDAYADMPLPAALPPPLETPPCSRAYLSTVLLQAAHRWAGGAGGRGGRAGWCVAGVLVLREASSSSKALFLRPGPKAELRIQSQLAGSWPRRPRAPWPLLFECSAAERDLASGKRITATSCMAAKVMRFVLALLELPAKGPGGKVRRELRSLGGRGAV